LHSDATGGRGSAATTRESDATTDIVLAKSCVQLDVATVTARARTGGHDDRTATTTRGGPCTDHDRTRVTRCSRAGAEDKHAAHTRNAAIGRPNGEMTTAGSSAFTGRYADSTTRVDGAASGEGGKKSTDATVTRTNTNVNRTAGPFSRCPRSYQDRSWISGA
jgi:hypothetical protein